jgi:GTP-binding protein HflX
MKNKLEGHTSGLKADQSRRLSNLFRRKIPPEYIITPEIAREMMDLSDEIKRQIGLLVDRHGRVVDVLVGDNAGIVIPDISQYRTAAGRLRGLKCVHTHLGREALSRDDLTDLSLLRLDMMAAIVKTDGAGQFRVHGAHLLPGGPDRAPYKILEPLPPNQLDIGCDKLIAAIEDELGQAGALRKTGTHKERAILVSVTTESRARAADSLKELAALAKSAGIDVVDTVLQQKKTVDARFLMGRGKLSDLVVLALQQSVNLLIFDQELNPSQIRSIADQVELNVIDRTQLILDIFARRAQSREGKLQVEHAQLKYLLPRLATKNTAMSRLTGGIGGRGPGETKLEINRRRARDKIVRLEKELEAIKGQRRQQRTLRNKKGVPVVSIIGYTNAGKSTLLNTLTKSAVAAENRLFMTLDPSSRRLRFPRDIEVIITDTVGFIRDLPKELMVAFRATLEELEHADLFIHVVDISNDQYESHITAVKKILTELELDDIPVIYALNKQDRIDAETAARIAGSIGGIAISADNEITLVPFIQQVQERVEQIVQNNAVHNP